MSGLGRRMRRLLLAAALAGCTLAANALPTLEAVEAEVGQGHTAQAEAMMREVIAARPGSARAHYVYAEILARDRQFDRAVEEAAQARRIDPALAFTQPEKFRAFEQLLAREQAATRRVEAYGGGAATTRMAAAPAAGGGIPGWVWPAALAVLAVLGWRWFAMRQPAPVAGALAPGAAGAPAYGGAGYPPPYGATGYPPPAAPGSGLLGTGLAVAGGVAAGMLAEKLLAGHHDTNPGAYAQQGGLVPGMFDDGATSDAAHELEQRPIDFGSGDGWGGDDAGSAGDADGW